MDDGCGPPIPTAPGASGQSSAGQASSGATSDNSSSSTPSSSAQGSQNSSGTTSGSSPGASSNSSNQTGQSSIGQPLNGQPVNPYAGLQPTGPVEGPVIGAFITGVGGPTNEDICSVAIYQGGRKYSQWEFIWNPVLDQARALQQGMSAAAAPQAPPSGARWGCNESEWQLPRLLRIRRVSTPSAIAVFSAISSCSARPAELPHTPAPVLCRSIIRVIFLLQRVPR